MASKLLNPVRFILPKSIDADLLKRIYTGVGTPEGVVVATTGCLYLRQDGGAGTSLYVKETATGNTGWVAK